MVKDINNKIEKSKNWASKICNKLILKTEQVKYKIILFSGLSLGMFISYMRFFEQIWYMRIIEMLMLLMFLHTLYSIKKCFALIEMYKKQKQYFEKCTDIELIDNFCVKNNF